MTTTTTNSLEWGAAGIPPRARALQVVEDRQERISRIQRNLEQGRETLGAWRDATQFLGDRAGHLMDRQGASAHSTIQYFEGRLQTLTASRAAIQRQLISALRRLATLPPDPEPITLTTGYIREQLKNCPHLTGRIGLAPSRRQVTWNLSGIVMRPHGQLPQGITVDEGAQPEVLLGDVRVQLRLPTSSRGAEIQLRPRSPEAGRPNTFVGDAPHPHVLSNYQPCWGDWGGPITEALHARDIGLVNDLIKTFLGQAYSEDIAGRHWVQWIPGYVVGRRYHYSAVGGWGEVPDAEETPDTDTDTDTDTNSSHHQIYAALASAGLPITSELYARLPAHTLPPVLVGRPASLWRRQALHAGDTSEYEYYYHPADTTSGRVPYLSDVLDVFRSATTFGYAHYYTLHSIQRIYDSAHPQLIHIIDLAQRRCPEILWRARANGLPFLPHEWTAMYPEAVPYIEATA